MRAMLVALALVASLSLVFCNRTSKFTIEELMSTTFPTLLSSDIDLDPCKAGNIFVGFM